jgi:hypothetical protein
METIHARDGGGRFRAKKRGIEGTVLKGETKHHHCEICGSLPPKEDMLSFSSTGLSRSIAIVDQLSLLFASNRAGQSSSPQSQIRRL